MGAVEAITLRLLIMYMRLTTWIPMIERIEIKPPKKKEKYIMSLVSMTFYTSIYVLGAMAVENVLFNIWTGLVMTIVFYNVITASKKDKERKTDKEALLESHKIGMVVNGSWGLVVLSGIFIKWITT